MENTRIRLLTGTISCLVLAGIATARMTAAQGPEDRGAAPARTGSEPQSARQPGGYAIRPTPRIGLITEADPGNGTISYIPQLGGEPQSIKVTAGTKYSTQTIATVADLKIGDRIQVQGVPIGITASSILTGDLPDLPATPEQGARGDITAPVVPGSAAGQRTPNAGGQENVPAKPRIQAAASATGVVKSLSPLSIALGSDVTITLHLSPGARVYKVVPTTFSRLKRGDRLVATGQTDSDGAFTATGIAVNLDLAGVGQADFAAARSTGTGKASTATAGDDFVQLGSSTSEKAPVVSPADTVALQLLQSKCGCHNGSGQGPDLSHEGSKRSTSWLAAYIANPKSKDPQSRMPAMSGRVSSADITKMANYLAKSK